MYMLVRVWALDVWGELVPSKIFNPPFPVLTAGHSMSYSCVCNVDREWVYGVGLFLFFLNFPVWLVCYAHVFHVCLGGANAAVYHTLHTLRVFHVVPRVQYW